MILCFGEALLRFAPTSEGKWIEQSCLATYIGGAELNVALALAKWDIKVKYCTALPNNYLSDDIISYLQSCGIDTSCIIRSAGRMGNYILPMGEDFKNKGVIYDREYSSFSKLTKEEIDFDDLFKEVTWFHLSAICPALNHHIASLCLVLLKEAKERNIRTSIDFNYRNRLWQYGVKPSEIMGELIQFCDIVMGNIWAMESLLDIPVDSTCVIQQDYLKASQRCVDALIQKYDGLKTIAFTYRFDHASEPHYFATLYHEKTLIISDQYKIKNIEDKVGSGDCFMAALIYGIINQWKSKEIIDKCVKAAINKLDEKGDHTNTRIEDI